ncbi:phage neck terminator protein, partial [Salmonella enterica]
LVEAGTIYNLPELINNQWVRRYDLTITLSRKNIRTYNVRTLQDAPVSFFGD